MAGGEVGTIATIFSDGFTNLGAVPYKYRAGAMALTPSVFHFRAT